MYFQGIGEPPLLLATTVFFAIKDAIKAARAENGLKGRFDLDSPATVERIRMACTDKITALVSRSCILDIFNTALLYLIYLQNLNERNLIHLTCKIV